MIRITPSVSAKAASGYHRTSLRKQGEYYKENIKAHWHGHLADRLGLEDVTVENFDALVKNLNPATGKQLTPLQVQNRRVGWDITSLPPKSFSLVSALTHDPELERAFKEANREMMMEVERMIVAQANTQEGRFFEDTGTGLWAEFHHRIGRPVEHKRGAETVHAGQPLEHIHNFLISATYSPSRDKVLAVDPYLIFKSAPYLQSYFHSHLSHKLTELGYTIERTPDAWEITGVSRAIIERFSERSKIIDRIAEARGITDDKTKSRLGAQSRISKNKSVPEHELFKLWKGQLSPAEFDALQNLKGQAQEPVTPISAKEAIEKSLAHFLERNSVAEEKRVLGYALQLGYGQLLPQDVEQVLKSRNDILYGQDKHVSVLTTRAMVRAEDHMISLATSGKGKFKPLNPHHHIKRDFLNKDQVHAVQSVLNTQDQIIAIEGKAGAGKSTLLQELSDGLKASGMSMIPIAPSTQAVDVLRQEGFDDAQTIASFLIQPEQQRKIRNGVLCVDEASLCGVKTKTQLLNIAKAQKARVILSGNIRQHASPGEYGDALRILQKQAQIKTVHVQQNMRQKPADYKKAVDLIAKRKVLEGYKVLDQKMNAVQEIPEHEERMEKISTDYTASLKAGRKALIVSPTHAEGQMISQKVRHALRQEGLIGKEERVFETLKNLNLTESQKKDPVNYHAGHILRFVKNQKGGFKAGSHYEILPQNKGNDLRVRNTQTQEVLPLSLDQVQHFSLHQKTQIPLAVGDHIRPTTNLKSKEGSKVNNGTPHIIKGFTKQGDIQLANGKTLAQDSYHFAHNYVSTSHAAQGKTAQDVFVSMSEASLGGVNEQAFYVAVSRGRSRIQLYTSNKDELKSAIQRNAERMSAREIAKAHEQRQHRDRQRAQYQSRTKTMREHEISRQNKASRHISKAADLQR